MSAVPRSGRPRASSRETIAEAACELFLEQGYADTSVSQIAQRAGVSRTSFFNYFSSKSDILWGGLDERLDALEAGGTGVGAQVVDDAIRSIAEGFAPDSLALALVDPAAMGLDEELEREASVRRTRVARYVADRLREEGAARMRAEIVGAAYGGAVLAALAEWAARGPSRTALVHVLESALAELRDWR